MASAFAHAFLAYSLGKAYPKKERVWKFSLLAAFCSIFPDADVIMFKFGVPYEHFFGHRGFSHSLVFALLLGLLVTKLFYRDVPLTSRRGLWLVFFFFLCTASHTLLDAMTSGGLGVAVFSPFDNERYFLPWRPIKVSPIGVGRFFTQRGIDVIRSELVCVGLPSLGLWALAWALRKVSHRREA
ncbi:MAG: metal-dependent hydrolase [Rufibacter sp.]